MLAAAGLPAFRLGGRPLADTLAGRALLGLLNLQRQQFSRPAVMTWLSSLPHHGDGPSLAQWDRISRDAGVLRGVEQWRHRLEHKLAEHRLTLEELQAQDAEEKLPRQRFLRGEIHAIEQMIRQISDMAERTRPRGEQSWSRLADWALQLRERFVRPAGLGSEDRDDIAAIDQVIESLRAAGSIDPEITVERFVETLEEALRAKRRNAGRPGDGVVTGLLADAAGMTFDAVFVVGMNERAFPSPPAIDPIFPFEAGEDPLGRSGRRLSRERAAYLAAIRSARRVVLSFATFDGESRPAYPSRWLLDEVESVAGESVGPSEMRTLAPSSKRPWLTAPPSAEAAVLEHGPVLNLAERRVREALLAFRARAPLSTIALARRDDLPLGRALEATGARRSTVFTAFDGNVKEVAAGSAALATPLSSLHPISASGVEDWAECPFRFFLARVLEVEGTKRPEDEEHWAVSAMDKGSLIHRVIERFMRELGDTGRPSPADEYNPADHARIEAIAREEFAELEQRGLTGYRLAWLNEQSAILQDLHTFLDKDAEFRRSAGWRPAHFEQRFGFEGDWPPATVTVPSGEQALLRGLIDRLDFGPAGAYITDYKTGGADVAADFAADPVVGGRKVQLAVYSLAVRRRFQETGEPAVPVTAAYWFISSKGGFRRIELTDSARSDRRLVEVVSVVKRALQEGAFPQVPGEEREIPRRPPWENCNYCDYNRICPTGRDQLRERKRNQPGADLHDGLLVGALGGEA
jgi:RecB family exonuclease